MIKTLNDLVEAMESAANDEWREFASCKGLETPYFIKVFIGEEDEDPDEEQASAFCNACCVQLECMEDAIKWQDGGFRGISEMDRERALRHRKRYNQHFLYDLEEAGIGIES